MPPPRRWFQVGEVFVCAPPKCGGTALYRAVLKTRGVEVDRHEFWTASRLMKFYTADEMSATGKRALMAVRDPVSRFVSLWRNKCRDGDAKLPFLSGLSPEQLIRLIESQPMGNVHWMRQVEHYRDGVELVPYLELLDRIGIPKVSCNTTQPKVDDPPMPVDRILSHYRQDAELASRAR